VTRSEAHPSGPLSGYVLEGMLTLEHEGRPVTTYKGGDAFYADAGKVHVGINDSAVPLKFLATLVVEKGKPPVSQAITYSDRLTMIYLPGA
jgi:quercetin dioxygenase-like cupin family protein